MLPPLWPYQARVLPEIIAAIVAGEHALCIASPTGSGKTRLAIELILWATDHGMRVALYTTRKMLTEQIAGTLKEAGISFGVRASGYDELADPDATVQICSSPTEHSRVFTRKTAELFPADLVLIDEVHMQRGPVVQQIIGEHRKGGAAVVTFTATPVGISHIADRLIVATTKAELRSYTPPALVPAHTFACPEIDTAKIKRDAKTGEFNRAELRKIYTTHIYGNVLEEFRRLNPDNRPTLVFWPGVEESLHGCRVFNEAGIPSAHIDGEDIELDGNRYLSNRGSRDELLRRHKAGELVAVHNRWVLREGIDLPYVQHLVLATPVGSVVAYVQIVGRVLRYHPSHDSVTIADHGGNWWRHPSPNADIDWERFFDLPERAVSEHHIREQQQKVRENKELEFPCEHCGKVLRKMSAPCPNCGKLTKRRGRMVIQEDGRLRAMSGDPVKVPKTYTKPDVLQRWEDAYYRCKKTGRTLAQARGLFIHQCIEDRVGYFEPPMNLPLMPRDPIDWSRKIDEIPRERLISRAEWEAREVCHAG